MTVKAQLLIRLGPFELSTRHNYIAWGRWGMWVHPFDHFYRSRVEVTRFGPGSRTWRWPRKGGGTS